MKTNTRRPFHRPGELFNQVLDAFAVTAELPDLFRARAVCRTFAARLGHELLTQATPALETEHSLHLFASVSQIFANKPPVCALWKVNLATVLYNQVLSPRGAEPEIFAFLRKVAKDMQIGMCSAKPDDILENLWRTTAAMN
jgi:hypothetical protein